jgi:hypothetical protein
MAVLAWPLASRGEKATQPAENAPISKKPVDRIAPR